MNRLFKVFLALCLPVIAVVVLLLNTRSSSQPDLRQLAVLSYVAFKNARLAQPLTVGQYVLARMPQNFRADIGGETFGESVYYRTAQRYAADEQPILTFPLTATMPPPTYTKSNYLPGRPMPYPPTDLWCVQLISSDPATPKAVLVAQHQDMYNAEWIVHEVDDLNTVLATVGCAFASQ